MQPQKLFKDKKGIIQYWWIGLIIVLVIAIFFIKINFGILGKGTIWQLLTLRFR